MAAPCAGNLQDSTALGMTLTGPCPLMKGHMAISGTLNVLQHMDMDILQHINSTEQTICSTWTWIFCST